MKRRQHWLYSMGHHHSQRSYRLSGSSGKSKDIKWCLMSIYLEGCCHYPHGQVNIQTEFCEDPPVLVIDYTCVSLYIFVVFIRCTLCSLTMHVCLFSSSLFGYYLKGHLWSFTFSNFYGPCTSLAYAHSDGCHAML